MSDPDETTNEALGREVHHLRREVSELSSNVSALVDAWKTAQGVVRFVKVVGAIATSAAALWALVKLGTGMKP
jgi:hypothetical protein